MNPLELARRVRDVLVDPPHRQGLRVARMGLSTGFLLDALEHPVAAAAVAGQRGLNAAMLYALHAASHPDRPALVDERRALTFREVDGEVNAVAHLLLGRFGLRRGDAVALAVENRAEYLVAWFAAMRAGVRVIHAGAHPAPAELSHMLKTAGGRVVLASASTRDVAMRCAAEVPGVQVLDCDAADGWTALVAQAPRTFPERPRRVAENVVFTSGTTGRPKGAARDFQAFGLRELSRVLERLPFRCGDRHLLVAPLHHSAPQVFALLQVALGNTVFLAPKFDAQRTLEALSLHRVNSVFVVPTMLRRMLELPASVHAACPTPELRAVVSGAAEFPPDLRRAAIERFSAEAVFDFYGATELGWVTLIRGDEMRARPGSVGRPLAGQQVRIVDGQGRVLGPREVGQVAVRNAQTMLGYTGDAQATQEAVKGGWATVEDTGFLDEEGYLFLAGRARDLVKSGGVNVYPAEVERVLCEDPQVREVCVLGLPDVEWGERVVAVVVPRGASFDAEAARVRARQSLSPAKVPREWRVVAELPRNPNGKVLRAALKASLGAPL